jgi:fatty-acyl-CoA synthase
MVLGSVLGIVHGATVVYLGEAFDPVTALETIQEERCTLFAGVPTMFVAILNHPRFSHYDLTSMRLGFIVGAPCPVELMRRIVGEMHVRDVMIGYGMTEASGGVSQTATDDTLERRVGTVGRAHPHLEIKIVDPAGRMVPRGVQGEICIRGYSVMQRYWNGEAETKEAINASHWLHSGDLGTMDVGGYIAITGRSKDMVIRGGENIYPREVEEFLYRHPAVADVHCFGVPDTVYGEELCAWIKLREGATATEDDIRTFCQGQITHFKIPRHVRFVDGYPMTVSGKVQKFVMRELMTKELGARAVD